MAVDLTRRRFLTALGVGTAAFALADLDRLTWQPSARTYFDLHRPSPILALDGRSFTIGDLIEIEGQFAINPITGLYSRQPQLFVVTADVDVSEPTVPCMPLEAVWPPLAHRQLGRTQRVRPVLVGQTVTVGKVTCL